MQILTGNELPHFSTKPLYDAYKQEKALIIVNDSFDEFIFELKFFFGRG